MFNVSNNQIITITRGDSAYTTLFINLGTEIQPAVYFLKNNDKVYFAIMEPNQPFEHAIVRKVLTKEDEIIDADDVPYVHINFKSEDTEFLLPGTYYYMVKLFRPADPLDTNSTDRIDTIVPKRKFIILDL